ncbi:hypothetical protein D3C76_903710 [compost metagenome]
MFRVPRADEAGTELFGDLDVGDLQTREVDQCVLAVRLWKLQGVLVYVQLQLVGRSDLRSVTLGVELRVLLQAVVIEERLVDDSVGRQINQHLVVGHEALVRLLDLQLDVVQDRLIELLMLIDSLADVIELLKNRIDVDLCFLQLLVDLPGVGQFILRPGLEDRRAARQRLQIILHLLIDEVFRYVLIGVPLF